MQGCALQHNVDDSSNFHMNKILQRSICYCRLSYNLQYLVHSLSNLLSTTIVIENNAGIASVQNINRVSAIKCAICRSLDAKK